MPVPSLVEDGTARVTRTEGPLGCAGPTTGQAALAQG